MTATKSAEPIIIFRVHSRADCAGQKSSVIASSRVCRAKESIERTYQLARLHFTISILTRIKAFFSPRFFLPAQMREQIARLPMLAWKTDRRFESCSAAIEGALSCRYRKINREQSCLLPDWYIAIVVEYVRRDIKNRSSLKKYSPLFESKAECFSRNLNGGNLGAIAIARDSLRFKRVVSDRRQEILALHADIEFSSDISLSFASPRARNESSPLYVAKAGRRCLIAKIPPRHFSAREPTGGEN